MRRLWCYESYSRIVPIFPDLFGLFSTWVKYLVKYVLIGGAMDLVVVTSDRLLWTSPLQTPIYSASFPPLTVYVDRFIGQCCQDGFVWDF